MTRSEIVQELLAEYEQQRSRNVETEIARRREAERAVPGLAAALSAREDLIFSGIRGMLASSPSATDITEQMSARNREIQALLVSGGYPKDWLEPVCRCAKCRDTGYVGEPIREMCSCMQSRLFSRLCESIGLPDDGQQSYENWDSSLFSDRVIPGYGISPRKAADFVRENTISWVDAWPQTSVHTILLTGQSGLGKTFTLRCMARRLLSRNINVMLVTAYQMLEASRKAFFSGKSDDYNALMSADVLMIDDLGSEPMLDNVTVSQLFNVLNERQNAGQATVFSSNLTMKEIRDRYTERIASRLSDTRTGREFRFFGDDLRTQSGEGKQ